MHKVLIPKTELYDEVNNEFIYVNEQTLKLEHSLISISKWESKWCRPFLSSPPETLEETIDYIRCMTLNQNVDPHVYLLISEKDKQEINNYILAPMSATTFSDDPTGTKNREIITSEVIYYWMIALNIPSEYEKWHLNRLLNLIKICNIKNSPPKKMSKRDIAAKYNSINQARRAALNSKG